MKRSSSEPASDLDRLYWGVVEAALTKVFEVDPGIARERVERLIDGLATLSPMAQELTFHDEPLSVAADLVRRSVTQRDLEVYDRLSERSRWIDEAQSESGSRLSNF